MSKRISSNMTGGECRNLLIDRYKTNARIQLRPGRPKEHTDFADLHTRVSVHKKVRGPRGDETWKEELKGSIDDILVTEVDGRLPARIILLAAAGYGKSTALAKLAYDWAIGAKNSSLKNVPFVFFLQFRKTKRKCSLGKAIVDQLLRNNVTSEEIEIFISETARMLKPPPHWPVSRRVKRKSGMADAASGVVNATASTKSALMRRLTRPMSNTPRFISSSFVISLHYSALRTTALSASTVFQTE